MPATKVPVIYSVATGRVRSWTVFDQASESDSSLAAITPGLGEAMLLIDMSDYGDLHALQALVTQVTGKIPVNDRYAIVDDKGDIIGAIIADVACGDALPGKELVKHDKASEGWTYDGSKGEFTDPEGAVIAAVVA